jgi:hypothetical protein
MGVQVDKLWELKHSYIYELPSHIYSSFLDNLGFGGGGEGSKQHIEDTCFGAEKRTHSFVKRVEIIICIICQAFHASSIPNSREKEVFNPSHSHIMIMSEPFLRKPLQNHSAQL